MTELAAGFSDNIKNALAVLPEKPGVYLMHDDSGKVIYVGKAVVLKNACAATSAIWPAIRRR